MNDLLKIGDVCQKLNITGRTLRYYEEIGLIQSIRKEDSSYRYYSLKSLSRIKQILTLRKLTFSIKEIQQLFSFYDSNAVLTIFNDKLNALKSEMNEQETLIKIIQKIIGSIESEAAKYENTLTAVETVFNSESKNSSINVKESINVEVSKINTTLGTIRIINLRPMRVASYCAVSEHPEDNAWKVMRDWVNENKLDELFSTRYFGFNNPDPTPGNNVYGYEVWVTVGENVQGNDYINIKEFKGGLYAVATTNVYDIIQSWQELVKIIDKSDLYKLASHRWLEEHLIVNESSWGSNLQIDLYCPIEML